MKLSTRIPTSAALAAALWLPAPLGAQDPPAPPGGFAIEVLEDLWVTWSDGYRTKMDIYRPLAPPPATGWPGVLAVHGSGGHRKIASIRSIGNFLAAAGYAVYAYDVSGDGGTPGWNPGFPPRSLERRLVDAAESHGVAQQLVAGSIDAARLAVTGVSQGGHHSTDAAAWSGRLLPALGYPAYVTHYPTVLAVAPEISPLDFLGNAMPNGVLANDEQIENLSPTHPLLLALDAGDYPGALAILQSTFPAGALALLRDSDVPIFVMLVWQDYKHQLPSSVDAFATLKSGVPRRLLLSTGGHNTPHNDMEEWIEQDLRRRWFDRFVKGVPNQVELEAFAEIAVEPDEPAFSRRQSIWEHRQDSQWPPATALTSLHLRGNGSLTFAAPRTGEPGPALAHRVMSGYDLIAYVQEGASKNSALLVTRIPKVERRFESAPLPAAVEVYGRPHLELHADDTTGVFQLSAELAHVDAAGAEHFITFGTGATRTGIAGRSVLAFDLGDIAHVVPAGNRLRLTVMNLAHHEPPQYERVRYAPYFTDTDTTLVLDPGAPSRIDVPLRPYQPNASPRSAVASAAVGIDHALRVDAGASHGGRVYALFVGASGEAPGLPFLGSHLALNPDAWTTLGAMLQNTVYFPGFVGLLDAQGRAPAAMVFPAGPLASTLIGTRFTFAGLVLGPGFSLGATFGPATLVVDP